MAEALGAGSAEAGHDIVCGARDAARASDLASRVGASASPRAEAATHGDAVLDVVAPLSGVPAGPQEGASASGTTRSGPAARRSAS
ncbi:NAD(P)-binding domain-containing protein [Streptomyces sp. NPDC003042]